MAIKVVDSFKGLVKNQSVAIFTMSKGKKSDFPDGYPSEVKDVSQNISKERYEGKLGQTLPVTLSNGQYAILFSLEKKSEKSIEEQIRIQLGKVLKQASQLKIKKIVLDFRLLNDFSQKESLFTAVGQGIKLSTYKFSEYLSKKNEELDITVTFGKIKKGQKAAFQTGLDDGTSINVARDFINEPPNVLNSEVFSKRVQADVKKNLKGVKIKVLGKSELKKEKMNLFLSVNQGSAFQPQLVHLTYSPKGAKKHFALVGKGLTFDTGGYSLKPSSSIIGMKFDMGGAATVYGAFRSAVLRKSPHKISLFLGMTDNAVNEKASLPDSIVKGRNGKTVEILNTDAEGRLVMADVLDYACDFKPDHLIDAATLTGACLIALGSECCALMTNSQKFADKILKTAKSESEYMWQLPILKEWSNDMKGSISDLKNIGSSRFAGTPKAAAFLQEFVRDGVEWAHLDVAGVASDQKHLSYCPPKGASGTIIRTLTDLLCS